MFEPLNLAPLMVAPARLALVRCELENLARVRLAWLKSALVDDRLAELVCRTCRPAAPQSGRLQPFNAQPRHGHDKSAATAPINTLPDTGNHANFFDSAGTGN